ncbi:MAG: hypothetical protein IE914_08375 [Thiotrichales bacterium]|nr:hypothetical protein [Thiotrichales bacterium]
MNAQQLSKDCGIKYDAARAIIEGLKQIGCPEDEMGQAVIEVAAFVKNGTPPNQAIKNWVRQKTANSSSQKSSSSLIEFSQAEAAELIAIGREKGANAHALINAAFLQALAGRTNDDEIQARIEQSRQSVIQALQSVREGISLANVETLGKVLWGQPQPQNYLPSASSVVTTEVKSES